MPAMHNGITLNRENLMNTEMVDPNTSLLSFQQALLQRTISLVRVRRFDDLYSYLDEPSPGSLRFTYARLAADKKTVVAFASFVRNGKIDAFPCVSVGYAVPMEFRGHGYAKQLVSEAVQDIAMQAWKNEIRTIFIEAVIDINNIASQHVAQAVLSKAEREQITDSHSGKQAFRYTSRFDTKTGQQF